MGDQEELRAALAVLAESARSGLAAATDAVGDAVTLLARKAQLHALYQPQEWEAIASVFLENAVFESLFVLVKRAPPLLPRALDVVSGLTNVSKDACAALVERGGVELLCAELRALGCRDDIFTGHELSAEEAANIVLPDHLQLLLSLVTGAFHVARTYSASHPRFRELHMLELLVCVVRATEKSASELEDAVRVKCLLAISYFDHDATKMPPERRLAALQYMHATLDACLSAEQHEHRGTNALDVVRALGNFVNASEEKTASCVQCGTIALLERLLTDARSSEEEVLEAIQCVEVLALTDAYKAQLRDSHKLMQALERFSNSPNERLKWVAGVAREEVNETTMRVFNPEAVKRCATAKPKRVTPQPQARKSNAFASVAKLIADSKRWKKHSVAANAMRAAAGAPVPNAATPNGVQQQQQQDAQPERKASVARKASVTRQSSQDGMGTARKTSVSAQRQTPTGLAREKSNVAPLVREKTAMRQGEGGSGSGTNGELGTENDADDSDADAGAENGELLKSIAEQEDGGGGGGGGDESEEAGHVLLSYQSDWTEQVSALRNALQATGVRCWMANFDMGQDVWGSMAFAVEGAAVVLICYSNSYKMSKYCRCEATYSMRINKPRIPLRFEPNYQADGWLGIQTTTELEYDLSTPGSIPDVPQSEVEAGVAAAKLVSDAAPETRTRRVSTWAPQDRKISRPPAPTHTQQPSAAPSVTANPAAAAQSSAAATKSSKPTAKNASKMGTNSMQQIKKMAQQQVAATIEKAEKNVSVKGGGGGGGGGARDVEITLLRQEGLKTEQIRVLTMNKVTLSTWKILEDSDWRFMFPAVGERRLIQEAVKNAAAKADALDRQNKAKT